MQNLAVTIQKTFSECGQPNHFLGELATLELLQKRITYSFDWLKWR
jgi:hypothetical protein